MAAWSSRSATGSRCFATTACRCGSSSTGCPPNLRARPTLSVTLESARAGARPADAELSHPRPGLEGGLCRLVRRGRGQDRRPGLDHAHQHTGTTFNNADTLLVAGDARRRQGRLRATIEQLPAAAGTDAAGRHRERRPREARRLSISIRWPSGRRSPTPRPSRSASSTSQGAPARKAYEFRSRLARDDRPSRASADDRAQILQQRAAGGLGDALPGGHGAGLHARLRAAAAVHRRERDRPHADGLRARHPHRPGLRRQGPARSVREDREKGEARYGANSLAATTMRYTLTNARPQPVTVDLIQSGLTGRDDTRIVQESQKSEPALGRRGDVARDRSRPMARRRSPPPSTRVTEPMRRALPRPPRLARRRRGAGAAAGRRLAGARRRSSVTVYRAPERGAGSEMDSTGSNGFALITETRTVVLPAGRE